MGKITKGLGCQVEEFRFFLGRAYHDQFGLFIFKVLSGRMEDYGQPR